MAQQLSLCIKGRAWKLWCLGMFGSHALEHFICNWRPPDLLLREHGFRWLPRAARASQATGWPAVIHQDHILDLPCARGI